MTDGNQDGAPPGGAPPDAAPPPWPPEPGWTSAPPLAPAPGPPPGLMERAVSGALVLAVLGGVSVLLGQVESAIMLALATLFYVAQAADAVRAFARAYVLLSEVLLLWLPSLAGAIALGALTMLLAQAPHTPLRLGFALFSGLGAAVTLGTLSPAVANALARAMLRDPEPGHVARLAVRTTLVTMWICLPVWAAMRDQIADLLRDPAALVNASRLAWSLGGYVVLAFAAVGLGVRRDLRGALRRLGLTWPRPSDLGWVLGGVVVLWLFNLGSEGLERSVFPSLWRSDQRFTETLAGVMQPAQMVLLGLSAGIGEEITLRGALQPRLGLWTTAVLFALLHVQYTWFGMASIAVFGIILGALRLRSGTTVVILVHACYDLLAIAGAATTRG